MDYAITGNLRQIQENRNRGDSARIRILAFFFAVRLIMD